MGMETVAVLLATFGSTLLFVLTISNAGPLWRDEVNTINLAQMPTLHDLWHNQPFESFPSLYPLLLRFCGFAGLAGSDVDIRLLGFYVGFLVLGSFWLCARWLGGRAPTLSLGLIGFLPPFLFIVGANRAYGLATFLLIMSFASLWRMVQKPSWGRIVLAAVCCLLFAHCVYYDVVFLAGMLAGGALVAWRRRQWGTLGWLTGIGAVSAGSLAIYWPIIRAGSVYVPLMQWPYFTAWTLFSRAAGAVTARETGETGHAGLELLVWIALVIGVVAVAVLAQRKRPPAVAVNQPEPAATAAARDEVADRALYCATSMVLGVAGYIAFLYHLHYWTQPWYYVEMFCLCGVALDGMLGANWSSLRPWGWLRITFMLAMIGCYARAAWTEAHTRRSDLDLVAAVLTKYAAEGDLIVVHSVWEGITFNRYYHGPAKWETIPPVSSHLVHRNDMVTRDLRDPNTMAPVLNEAMQTLQNGHTIWYVGNMSAERPQPPESNEATQWCGTFFPYWNAQMSALVLDHATKEEIIDLPLDEPVCNFENLPVTRFEGYRSGSRTNSAAGK